MYEDTQYVDAVQDDEAAPMERTGWTFLTIKM
jgi:hypothetical protein